MYIPYRVRDVLLSVKGIVGIRVCFDDYRNAFSFHAMSSKNKELGYIIPDISYDFYPIIREWGYSATDTSDYLSLNL